MAIHLQQGVLRHYAECAHFDPDAVLQLLDQNSSVAYICSNGRQVDENLELFFCVVEYIDETNSLMQVVPSKHAALPTGVICVCSLSGPGGSSRFFFFFFFDSIFSSDFEGKCAKLQCGRLTIMKCI